MRDSRWEATFIEGSFELAFYYLELTSFQSRRDGWTGSGSGEASTLTLHLSFDSGMSGLDLCFSCWEVCFSLLTSTCCDLHSFLLLGFSSLSSLLIIRFSSSESDSSASSSSEEGSRFLLFFTGFVRSRSYLIRFKDFLPSQSSLSLLDSLLLSQLFCSLFFSFFLSKISCQFLIAGTASLLDSETSYFSEEATEMFFEFTSELSFSGWKDCSESPRSSWFE